MNNDFFDALELLAKENNIELETLIEKIKQGILKAIKKEYPDTENINIEINPETGKFMMKLIKTVVEGEPEDPANEMNIDQAKTISKRSKVGGVVEIKLNSAKFGRVAAQMAKQQIKHDIKEFEKERLLAQYEDKVHECVSATVQKVEPATLNAVLTIEKNEVYLVRNEQIPEETLRPGDIIKVYVVGIANPEKKPSIKISRKHKDLVKRLFEIEVPEIYDGTVEVKAISRESGSRSKIAVFSKDANVDAVGACIGPRRSRISKIVEELNGEKIDIIIWSEDDAEFIGRALSPAEVISVDITDVENKACRVVVPNNQLSLAIGNKGQNAKLASRLTGGYKIDIVPENAVNEG
ncbi:MAG: transcription termination/antitermination protein NusA [Clostridiales bacterium]|nr:transcription termination/antitermination protein NusA [Clostridiales bacterium]